MHAFPALAVLIAQSPEALHYTIEDPFVDCSENRRAARSEIWKHWESKQACKIKLVSFPKDGPEIATIIEMGAVNQIFQVTCKTNYKKRIWVGQQDHWQDTMGEFAVKKISKFFGKNGTEKLRFIGPKGETLFIL